MVLLQQELSHLEVEPLQIVEPAPGREGFYTPPGFDLPPQESSLDTLTAQADVEIAGLLTGGRVLNAVCCCCCPACCC